jgi:PilZ domain
MQRRREHRYEVWESVVLTVFDDAGNSYSAATVIDLSTSGYRILASRHVDVGSRVLITLNAVAIAGVARHCEHADADSFTVGVEITEVSGGVAECRSAVA